MNVYAVQTRPSLNTERVPHNHPPKLVAEAQEYMPAEGDHVHLSQCDGCGCDVYTARYVTDAVGRHTAVGRGILRTLYMVCEGDEDSAEEVAREGGSPEAVDAHRTGCGARYPVRLYNEDEVEW